MKISVFLKDPDSFSEAVGEAVEASLKTSGLPEDEQEAVKELRGQKAWDVLRRWVEEGEYVSLEFDTDAGTATVKERK